MIDFLRAHPSYPFPSPPFILYGSERKTHAPGEPLMAAAAGAITPLAPFSQAAEVLGPPLARAQEGSERFNASVSIVTRGS